MSRAHFIRQAAHRTRLALALVLVVACAHSNAVEEEVEPRPDPIAVHVKNENFLDMNVSVVAGGVSRRLGQVPGNGSADFKITWNTANGQQIALMATPIGGRERYTSVGLSIGMGQMVEFRIASVLRQSAVGVREPQ